MEGTLSKRDFLMALAEGKAVKIGNNDYYRLKDNEIQRNSQYSSGNWSRENLVTPLLLDAGIAVEEPQEHYYPLDVHEAIDALFSRYVVTDKQGASYAIDCDGNLVSFPDRMIVRLGDLRGKRFYRNQAR